MKLLVTRKHFDNLMRYDECRSSEPANLRSLHHEPSIDTTKYRSRTRVLEPSEVIYTRSPT